MNIYIIIKDGVTCKTCYTSIKTASRLIKGPHLNTIYTNLKKFGIYKKNNFIIEKLVLEKQLIRYDDPTKSFKPKTKLSTRNLGHTGYYSSNTAETDDFRDTGIDE